jgi:hypothetical protein
MFDNKTQKKKICRNEVDIDDIEEGICGRLRFFTLGFIVWMCGELVLIMAAAGANQLSSVLPQSIWWKVLLTLLLVGAALFWGVGLPLWYLIRSSALLFGLVISFVEGFLEKMYPMEFTNRPLFRKIHNEIFEEFL